MVTQHSFGHQAATPLHEADLWPLVEIRSAAVNQAPVAAQLGRALWLRETAPPPLAAALGLRMPLNTSPA
eukprot:CAMPEP_0172768086 /NCGR_PEP_ID=MMETSP1074-20121228/184078_1 /TAXON_ID=2916 /ORGANISM="Ceratium fusus, Strain PA161109" /LENGTH=69 /DNA_ID=CAMNT_0013603431 /DNA_START=97 /DNA_END=302 /DNA_ORIENTATION=-